MKGFAIGLTVIASTLGAFGTCAASNNPSEISDVAQTSLQAAPVQTYKALVIGYKQGVQRHQSLSFQRGDVLSNLQVGTRLITLTYQDVLEIGRGEDTLIFERWKPDQAVNFEEVMAVQALLSTQYETIESVEPDEIIQPQGQLSADPYSFHQWYFKTKQDQYDGRTMIGAANISNAKDYANPNARVVVAVIDDGVIKHPEIQHALLPGIAFSEDGNSSEFSNTFGCEGKRTHFHGTQMSGIIASEVGNGYGIDGIAPGAKILPVRVMSACSGGSGFDIAKGIVWAAGEAVDGVVGNNTPADVINLSLGADSGCTSYMQNAIDAADRRNVIVVSSAGNGRKQSLYMPANCAKVVSVGAVTYEGFRADYSNWSSKLTIFAPGGGYTSQSARTDVSLWMISPSAEMNEFNQVNVVEATFSNGTSHASALVSGIAALVRSVNPNVNTESFARVIRGTAKPMADNELCKVSGCTTGILDAGSIMQIANSSQMQEIINENNGTGQATRTNPAENSSSSTISGNSGSSGGGGSVTWVALLGMAGLLAFSRNRIV